jgi:hypothetical protein
MLSAAGKNHVWHTALADLYDGFVVDARRTDCTISCSSVVERPPSGRRFRIPERDLRRMSVLHRRGKLRLDVLSRKLYRRYGLPRLER